MDLIERLRGYSKAEDLHPDERATLLKAADELESAQKGAGRYRRLRDGGLVRLPYDDHGIGPEYPYLDELDAAIDQKRPNQASYITFLLPRGMKMGMPKI